MNSLKVFLFNRFNTLSFLTASVGFSLFLLMLRIKLTHSFFLIFLVWNLFLAIIPYAISLFLESKPTLSKPKHFLYMGTWLTFLPNAPYIVTDFIHLRLSLNYMVWLDFVVIASFAITGLAFYFLSINSMLKILKTNFKLQNEKYMLFVIFLLSSFGVYLGRFLRYNSWEIIQNPITLITDILSIIVFPKTHAGAWVFTIAFTCFLIVCHFILFKSNYLKKL
ncbi:DUF1361 domain-containing protein [Hanstruepera marina]|uniref:DUF1361 domain-containing protein n=1 Tax=Hanstruepera marina TaxID=2873265 RepID=UPI001CA61D0F|nr:DUF1361 domain-containing protein [Hanstruepera marina]